MIFVFSQSLYKIEVKKEPGDVHSVKKEKTERSDHVKKEQYIKDEFGTLEDVWTKQEDETPAKDATKINSAVLLPQPVSKAEKSSHGQLLESFVLTKELADQNGKTGGVRLSHEYHLRRDYVRLRAGGAGSMFSNSFANYVNVN